MKEYELRIVDRMLQRKLQGKGAVLVQGQRWCRKTTTANQIDGSLLDLCDTAVLNDAKEVLQILPKRLLIGETY